MKFATRALPVCALAAACLAALGLAWRFLPPSAPEGAAPPLAGWMENFAAAPAPAPAPAAPFVGRSGETYTLDGLRGKVVLVNFWATWCAPCVRELPSLLRLQARTAGREFAVLALSQDRGGWAKIAPFLARHGLEDLAVFHDPQGRFARAAAVRGLPTTVLYDRAGMEIGRLAGLAEWDSDEAAALIGHHVGR